MRKRICTTVVVKRCNWIKPRSVKRHNMGERFRCTIYLQWRATECTTKVELFCHSDTTEQSFCEPIRIAIFIITL